MAEAILGMPVVIKVFGALLLILVINRFCKHLAIAVGAGALAGVGAAFDKKQRDVPSACLNGGAPLGAKRVEGCRAHPGR